MPRRKEEKHANLVRPLSGEYYTPLEDWEVVALGDRVKIEGSRTDGKLYVSYYVRMDK